MRAKLVPLALLLTASPGPALAHPMGPCTAPEDVVEHWDDGTVRARYSVDSGGRRHGSYRSFHENGEPHVEARYSKGLLDGKYEERSADGARRVEGKYAKGQKHGSFRVSRGRELVQELVWKKGALVEVDGVEPFPKSLDAIAEELARIYGDTEPQLVIGGKPGKDGDAALLERHRDSALRHLNAYRYLCDVPWDVERDPELDETCQLGARLARETGRLSHDPPNPGWDRDEYERGYEGAARSNLARAESARASVDQYMDDSDPTNVDKVGHRRACLDPRMQRTGFGVQVRFQAMWGIDRGRSRVPTWDAVPYPARGYTPMSHFGERHAWSVTFNPGRVPNPDPEAVEVRVWELDGDYVRAEAPLELDHVSFARDTLVFRPVAGAVRSGGRYWVEVTGLEGKLDTLRYLVELPPPTGVGDGVDGGR